MMITLLSANPCNSESKWKLTSLKLEYVTTCSITYRYQLYHMFHRMFCLLQTISDPFLCYHLIFFLRRAERHSLFQHFSRRDMDFFECNRLSLRLPLDRKTLGYYCEKIVIAVRKKERHWGVQEEDDWVCVH